jgi:DNA polymerase elongation subunit (family B)
MMQYNISPETYCGRLGKHINIDQIIDGAFNESSIRNQMLENNITIAATGCMFQKDVRGFLPKLMDKMYQDRVVYKDKMIEAKKQHEASPSPSTERLIAQYHNMQLAKKIQLNSVYGALSNEYFRWFDMRLAESITLSGQLSIRWIEKKINLYLNKLFNTEKMDYVIACDTDSMYITLDKLVGIAFNKRSTPPTDQEIVTFLDKACQDKIEPFIDKCYEELAIYVNAYDQKMKMKREAIANKGIWLAKKHYILNVYNNEGVQYHEPKLKMMGIEAVKSSTPAACRTSIKKALDLIMTKDEEALVEFVEKFRSEFEKLEIEDIAFPRSCKKLSEYRDSATIYRKGTPIHVRGALVFNNLIKQKQLKTQEILEGDKIKFCYLKLPNPVKENVISIPQTIPRELGIDKYIDYDTQFEKSFLEFIRTVTNVIGWQIEKKANLEAFFG